MPVIRENIKKLSSGFKLGMGFQYQERVGVKCKGLVIFEMRDAQTGEIQLQRAQENVVTVDASLLVAALRKDPTVPAHGCQIRG